MKRISAVFVVTVILVMVALTVLYAHSHAQNSNRQVRVTNAPPTQSDNKAEVTRTPRKGKALVKRLPDGVEGVELKDGAVHLKDGYKFVKQGNGKVTVARINGNNATGTWACRCTGDTHSGSCEEGIESASLFCNSGTCTGTCKLSVVVKTVATAVFAY
jgi:hypothetical protein